jgi:class 3 adenylate cyclase
VLHKAKAFLDEMQALIDAGITPRMEFDKFLSGRRLLTSHTFRQNFTAEIIRTSDGIGVRDVSILFTDLKGSTAMYDRIGDLKAFALVNEHFERLGRAITRHRGAVIKTIGDAVMASFESPVDAVLAARDMLGEIERFNDEVGEREIVLKVGVHRGASIAVTLNDRLDFFGQTVNVAARVQGLADADEIYITEEVYRAPGVLPLLEGLHVDAREANLRGVKRTVSVYRIATHPPSAPGSSVSLAL